MAQPNLNEAYLHVFNRMPSEVVDGGLTLRERDLELILDFWRSRPQQPPAVKDGEIWPLVSHHTFADRTLVGGSGRRVLQRALTMMLIHDGLVVADPILALERVRREQGVFAALQKFTAVTRDLAELEPLIDAKVLRTTSVRPDLSDDVRTAVLKVFGVDSSMRVFTNFVEAAGHIRIVSPGLFAEYVLEVQELYRRFGISIPAPRSIDEAEAFVVMLGAAVIEVSWQFAVVASDPACDLAFKGALERRLFTEVVSAGIKGDIGPGRHSGRLDLGEIPNLDPKRLTVKDALSIRKEDAFSKFRYDVRQGLDRLEVSENSGMPTSLAVASFEDAMRESARELNAEVRKRSFSEIIRSNSVHAAIGVAAAVPGGAMPAGIAGAASAATVIYEWLRGRRAPGQSAVSLRYLSMLGGVRSHDSVSA
ncbi:hypothetical protein [Actinomyces oris]|uniref:hypothetical protein n=1 Tax=Actinomyces oris TaxID=544580 RepID=UPI0011D191D5|nr:hypothetical protein [Actinomyces oris]